MRFIFAFLLLFTLQVHAEEPIIVLPDVAPLSNDLVVEPPKPPAPKKPNIVMSLSLLGKTGILPVNTPLTVALIVKNEGDGALETANLSIGLRGAMLTTDYQENTALQPNETKTVNLTLQAYKGAAEGTVIALLAAPNGIHFRQEFPLPFRDCTTRYATRLNELEHSTRKPLLEKLYSLRRADGSVTNTFHAAPANDDKETARIISLLRNNYGVDPALYSTSALGDIAFRSIAEMKIYLTQGESLAICTGVKEITSFYEERNNLLTARLVLYGKLKDKTYNALKAIAPDFALSLADFNDDNKRSETFMQLREDKLPANIKGLISNLYWLTVGEKRLQSLDNGFKDLYGKIHAAHKEECVCGN